MQKILLCFLALGCCIAVGCTPSGPELAPASGTVTLDGKPLEGAMVTYVLDSASAVAQGTTDASGKFTLSTDGKAGAPVGTGAVSVTKAAASQQMSAEEAMAKTKQGPGAPAATLENIDVKLEIPAKYASPGTSGLKATIDKGGNTSLSFELKSDGAAGGAADAEQK